MIEKDELLRRIEVAGKIRRWYQAVPYGKIVPHHHFDDGKTNRFSFGEGRWDNYIRPLIQKISWTLDAPNSTMCEIGCSAGLFLLRAWQQFKFKQLLGVEAANGGYEQLLITRDYYDKMPLVPYKLAVGPLVQSIADSDAPQLCLETFPMADLTLMSCVHYHMTGESAIAYFRMLAHKSMFLLVVTDENAGGPTNATSKYLEENLLDEKDWQPFWTQTTPKEKLAPSIQPRCKDLTGVLYQSKHLKRLFVDECFEKQVSHSEFAKQYYGHVFPKIIDEVLSGKITEGNCTKGTDFDWQNKDYYGSTAWPYEVAKERTISHIRLIKTMHDHGQEQPIALEEHLETVDPWDGFHRVAVMKYLGLKYIYGKDVIPDVWSQC